MNDCNLVYYFGGDDVIAAFEQVWSTWRHFPHEVSQPSIKQGRKKRDRPQAAKLVGYKKIDEAD